MSISRRDVLRAGIALPVVGAAVACSGPPGQTGELLRSNATLPQRFSLPLQTPDVLRPTSSDGGVDRYTIEARPVELEILPGYRTSALTYAGSFPGPTIVARRDSPVEVEHVNRLPVPMVVHLHGGHTPSADDGFPTDLVLPTDPPSTRRPDSGDHSHDGSVADPKAVTSQGRRVYRYPGNQPAATLWYHDHRMDFTGPMVYRGLAGFHLLRDESEEALGLPSGERDLPLMVTDRAFDGDGQFVYPSIDPTLTGTPGVEEHAIEGVLGDVVLVNGVPWPVAEVDAARYRLRILNASNARRYALRLDPPPPEGSPFVQVGSDAGLLGSPVGHKVLTMAPAERFDVVVDFGAYPVGTEVTVRNDLDAGPAGDVMRFVVARNASDDSRVPDRLVEVETLVAPPAAVTRSFVFGVRPGGRGHVWTINGRQFDPTRADAVVRPGQVERWRFGTNVHHPVHVHLASFQVVSRGPRGPGPMDAGWKDTVDLRPAEDVEVLVRFPDLPGRYVMHCHNLEHEDMMMMATIEIR
jgi:spore coat protein A